MKEVEVAEVAEVAEVENSCDDIIKVRPFDQFCGIIQVFYQDLESISDYHEEVAKIISKNSKADLKKVEKLLKEIKDKKYENASLKKLKELTRSLNKLTSTNQTFRRNIIVSLISRYDEFLNDILCVLWKDKKFEIKGEKTYSICEISNYDCIEEIYDDYIKQEIDDFLYKSHFDQIEYLDSYFKLGLKDTLDNINDFIELCERRNLLVHTGGKINKKYRANIEKFKISIDESCIKGETFIIKDDYINNAKHVIFEVSYKITQNLIRRLYKSELDFFERITNEEIGFPLLENNDWKLGEVVYSYLTKLPSKFISNDAWRKIYVINYCIVLFQNIKKQEMNKLLDSIDWSASGDEFLLAIKVLKEEYLEAKNIMISMNGKHPDKDAFLEWPLFKSFRDTQEFKDGFEKVFGMETFDAILENEIKEIEKTKELTKNA